MRAEAGIDGGQGDATVLARPATMTATGLVRMLHLHNLGPIHPVLQAAAVWRSPDEERAADTAVWSEFDEVGLLTQSGRLDADTHDTLLALSRPSSEFFGWITQHGKSAAALVAAHGDEAVRLLRQDNKVKLASIRTGALVEELADLMAGPPPARIDAVNIRRAALHGFRDVDSGGLLEDACDIESKDLGAVRALLAQPVTGLGELYAGARDHRRGYRVTERPVGFRDTIAGRVMIWISGEYVSIAPGTETRLVERLRQCHRDITDEAGR